MPATPARLICIVCVLACNQVAAQQLRVTTSADADSNAAHSFVIVQPNQTIPHGIKHDAPAGILAMQIPFIAELEPVQDSNTMLQWQVSIPSKHYGEIEVISKFSGHTSREKNTTVWRSQPLASTVADRHKFIFRPAAPHHQPVIYRKGLGANGERHTYGGGTRLIDDTIYNPRLSYQIRVNLLQDGTITQSYDAAISMDDKDLIRQEYINHYGIQRYGYGGNGNLPVPRRDELTPTPEKPATIMGNPLTESAYGLLVNDGMLDLVQRVADIYAEQQAYYREHPLLDLNKKVLPIPQSKLWLSGGWRNPERNEWYSNATNGIHQRGGAVDIIANEPPGDTHTAVVYWILWKGLQQNKANFPAYWQLETRGRPMRTQEFIEDIEPVNGIPDAFDKADHLHINIPYNTTVEE